MANFYTFSSSPIPISGGFVLLTKSSLESLWGGEGEGGEGDGGLGVEGGGAGVEEDTEEGGGSSTLRLQKGHALLVTNHLSTQFL